MKNLNLYALANELNLGEAKSGTIRVPFGRWDFGAKKLDDGRTVFFVQELTKDGAERMAAKINAGVADGEKGVPVYWGHPDVPELAHKYPDKRAKGWIKSATVESDALILSVEWLEENATDGFGWFSPYWGGPATDLGQGRYLKHLDSLTSVALINIPNIQEFRLANELQGGLNNNEGTFAMTQHLIDLAKRFDERVRLANEANYDESKHPRGEDGKWTSGGGSGGATVKKVDPKTTPGYKQEQERNRKLDDMVAKSKARTDKFFGARTKALQMLSSGALGTGSRANVLSGINGKLHETRAAIKYHPAAGTVPYESEARKMAIETRRGVHAAAILHGFKYNRSTHQYE